MDGNEFFPYVPAYIFIDESKVTCMFLKQKASCRKLYHKSIGVLSSDMCVCVCVFIYVYVCKGVIYFWRLAKKFLMVVTSWKWVGKAFLLLCLLGIFIKSLTTFIIIIKNQLHYGPISIFAMLLVPFKVICFLRNIQKLRKCQSFRELGLKIMYYVCIRN